MHRFSIAAQAGFLFWTAIGRAGMMVPVMDMEPVIAVAALVGVVWAAALMVRGGLLAGALLVLLAGTCFGHAAYQVAVQPIPLTSDRVLWVLLMIQLFVWWRWGLTARRRIGATEILLTAFLGVLGVSVLTHDWTMSRNLPASLFVFYYLMPFGLYWVGWRAKITERGMKITFALLGLFGVYLAVTAIAEKLEFTALVFPPYISSPEFEEFLGRSRGPLLNPAANGMLLGSCLAAGLMMWPYVSRWGKLALVAFAFLLGVGLFCTMTRSVWIGGALGLLLLVLLTLPRLYRPWLFAAALIGATVLAAMQWQNIVEFKRDKNLTARETASSVELRPILATIAWEMFCDRPLFGCGLGHYLDQHVNYLSNRDLDVPLEKGRGFVQHNIWLSLLTETGLLGAGLFLALMLAWLWHAWRLWRTLDAPLWMRQQGLFFLVVAINYLVNGMFHDMTIIPMIHMILFFTAGVTVNLQEEPAIAPIASLAKPQAT